MVPHGPFAAVIESNALNIIAIVDNVLGNFLFPVFPICLLNHWLWRKKTLVNVCLSSNSHYSSICALSLPATNFFQKIILNFFFELFCEFILSVTIHFERLTKKWQFWTILLHHSIEFIFSIHFFIIILFKLFKEYFWQWILNCWPQHGWWVDSGLSYCWFYFNVFSKPIPILNVSLLYFKFFHFYLKHNVSLL